MGGYSFRKNYVDLITSGAYVLFFLLMIRLYYRPFWIACIALIMVISMCAWVSTWRRRRMIADTPTSRIASAAQGYVELMGRGQPLDDNPLLSHLTGLPCLWYRWKVEQGFGDHRAVVDRGESDKSFILNDGSGRCIIDAYGAEVQTRHIDRWRDGEYSFTEWKLLNNDTIYAIGEFRTISGASSELNVWRDMGVLLDSWKKDREMLLGRFDRDGDGEISMEEWELARQEARREIDRAHREARNNSSAMHILSRPDNARSRYFIISNIEQNRLTGRYLLWTFFHLAAFLAALGSLFWIFNQG